MVKIIMQAYSSLAHTIDIASAAKYRAETQKTHI